MQDQLLLVQNFITDVGAAIKAEFTTSYDKYLDKHIRSLNFQKLTSFSPKVNKFFRPRKDQSIDHLVYRTTALQMLSNANVNLENISSSGDTILIRYPVHVLHSLEAYLKAINSPRPTILGTEYQLDVDYQVSAMVTSFQDSVSRIPTITNFSA